MRSVSRGRAARARRPFPASPAPSDAAASASRPWDVPCSEANALPRSLHRRLIRFACATVSLEQRVHESGARESDRTDDLLLTMQPLCLIELSRRGLADC